MLRYLSKTIFDYVLALQIRQKRHFFTVWQRLSWNIQNESRFDFSVVSDLDKPTKNGKV